MDVKKPVLETASSDAMLIFCNRALIVKLKSYELDDCNNSHCCELLNFYCRKTLTEYDYFSVL